VLYAGLALEILCSESEQINGFAGFVGNSKRHSGFVSSEAMISRIMSQHSCEASCRASSAQGKLIACSFAYWLQRT
jgi:hypothetical protein